MSEWLDPVESARNLIAQLEKEREECEAGIEDLCEEREAVLRAMEEAHAIIESEEVKISTLRDQERSLETAVADMEQSIEKVAEVHKKFADTASAFRHIKTKNAAVNAFSMR